VRPPCQKLFRLLGTQLKAFVFLAILLGGGMSAIFVQTLGWLTMLPTQLQETGSVTEAVKNTFDGEHPCELCIVAEQLREAEVLHTKA